jgi:hypothetical protein
LYTTGNYCIRASIGVIDERAIANLSLAAELTKNIEMKLGGSEKRDAIASITPKFLWLVKDFTLELLDDEGRRITANDYLEDSLDASKFVEKEGTGAVKIREAITKLFRQRECMVFVRPVEDESQLQQLNQLKLKNMRPQFIAQFKILKEKLFTECAPKMVKNKPVNGRMIATLLEQYIKAINKGAVPNITTAWENVIDNEIRRGYEDASKLYKEKTDTIYTSKELPMEQYLLLEKLFDIRAECDKVMRKGNRYSADAENADRLFKTYIDKLIETYQSREAEITNKNSKLSEE